LGDFGGSDAWDEPGAAAVESVGVVGFAAKPLASSPDEAFSVGCVCNCPTTACASSREVVGAGWSAGRRPLKGKNQRKEHGHKWPVRRPADDPVSCSLALDHGGNSSPAQHFHARLLAGKAANWWPPGQPARSRID